MTATRSDPLGLIAGWGVEHHGAAVVTPEGVAARSGQVGRRFPLASVTKLLTTTAVMVAVEERSVSLEDSAGPPGATLRHLLAHTSGLPFEGSVPVTTPGRRRIYSNTGIELAATHLADRTGIPFERYLSEAVFEPLGMGETVLDGSPAKDAVSTVLDLARWCSELFAPRLLHPDTWAEVLRPQWPDLAGTLPGFGVLRPNPWGLGFEIRGRKQPHWTGAANSPATHGHFGGSGTFLWRDPVAQVALVVLTDRPFGPWAARTWPELADRVLAAEW